MSQPPFRVPEQPRRIKLHGFQWIGLPFLLAVPIFAILGVFGETWVRADATGTGLSLSLEYPARYRYKQINTLELRVRNTTAATLDTVVVALDTAYASRFSTLMFVPSARAPFEVELLDLEAGEVALVWIELQAERYGRHRGVLEARSSGLPDTVRVPLSTYIFP